MAEKIATYQKVEPSLHVLIQMNIADIIKSLPKISRNTFEVFQLFVNAYGERELMPLVSKLFGEKLGVSKDALNAQIKEIIKLQQEQLAEIERVSKSLILE